MNFLSFFREQQQNNILVILPGGFKPPHKGHFEALKFLLKKANANQAKIFIGKKDRDGITQQQSYNIWSIYKNYIPSDIEIVPVTGVDKAGREATPLSMTYDFIESNKNNFKGFAVGAGKEDLSRFKGMESNKEKYPNTQIISIPPQFDRISGTKTRSLIQNKDSNALDFIPAEISKEDKLRIAKILGI